MGPFIVVLGGMNYRPAASRNDITPQIIRLGGCFTVATTHFLSKRLPNDRLMCMWRCTYCCMVHSSENNTLFPLSASPVSFSSPLVSGVVFVPACGTAVDILCWEISKRCWSLLLYLLSVKQHRMSCRSSLVSVVLSVSMNGLPWDDQTFSCHETCHQH